MFIIIPRDIFPSNLRECTIPRADLIGRPIFENMWAAYPGSSVQNVKALIGGRVNADWITNTCAIRMSRAFNYSNFPIPATYKKNWAVSGSDGKWYAYRVRDMEEYIRYLFGEPNISVESKPDDDQCKSKFLGKKGIIVFNVNIWDDATGHVTLWDGSKCGDKEYFKEAYRVSLWELPKAPEKGCDSIIA